MRHVAHARDRFLVIDPVGLHDLTTENEFDPHVCGRAGHRVVEKLTGLFAVAGREDFRRSFDAVMVADTGHNPS
jgi:hypothetical protein